MRVKPGGPISDPGQAWWPSVSFTHVGNTRGGGAGWVGGGRAESMASLEHFELEMPVGLKSGRPPRLEM